MPDLRGIWDYRTLTPLQRPRDLAQKKVLTEEEAVALEERAAQGRVTDNYGQTGIGLWFSNYWDRGTELVEDRRTSLIVDPPDGRIPPLTPEGRKRAAAGQVRGTEGPEQRGPAERCIQSAPLPRLPGNYNSNYQIFQTPEYVVILMEMIHAARIIPLDGRAHISHDIRQWQGDSRGRWEGDTLVIDTANFTDKTSFRGSAENLHLVERLTRVNADTINYEFTVDDPTTFTRPWTAMYPLRKTEGPLYEYACHEGNYGMVDTLSVARTLEKAESELLRLPTFVWVDRHGREDPLAAEPRRYQEFALSPDGTRLAVAVDDPDNRDLWIYDLTRGTSTRLTFDPSPDGDPIWTPDGRRVAFRSGRDGGGLFWKAADGTGEVEVLGKSPYPYRQFPQAFSPDGTALVFRSNQETSRVIGMVPRQDLGMLSLEGARTSTLLLHDEFNERNAALSPDGRWMAYQSDESGQWEVYVRPFPDVDTGRWQVSNDGGTWPIWHPEGRELFYVSLQGMMAMAIDTEPTFTPGAIELLFHMASTPDIRAETNGRVDLSPDGEWFLMIKR